ncbi:hypothetical protein [Salinarimonas sp.]|uniref:hypothetical protein n=1 Tax=Salinarimonas sp. TaxID=2766526 RepID=UPI0032D92B51
MSYHYTESGLDYVWLENGYSIETHPNYGDLVSIQNVGSLHVAIGRWLLVRTEPLTGAEFRFLRIEIDAAPDAIAEGLGVSADTICTWESARSEPVPVEADRLLRKAYAAFLDRAGDGRATNLPEPGRARALRLARGDEGWARAA